MNRGARPSGYEPAARCLRSPSLSLPILIYQALVGTSWQHLFRLAPTPAGSPDSFWEFLGWRVAGPVRRHPRAQSATTSAELLDRVPLSQRSVGLLLDRHGAAATAVDHLRQLHNSNARRSPIRPPQFRPWCFRRRGHRRLEDRGRLQPMKDAGQRRGRHRAPQPYANIRSHEIGLKALTGVADAFARSSWSPGGLATDGRLPIVGSVTALAPGRKTESASASDAA